MNLGSLALDVSAYRSSRHFRTLMWGRVCALLAFSMVGVVVSVHVYDLTGSTLAVALLSTVWGVSALVGSLFGGVIADRHDRRTTLAVCRLAALVAFTVLLLNVQWGTPQLWVIYAAAAVDAAFGAAGASAFSAAAAAVVKREHLPSAGALMAASLDIGASIAPALASVALLYGNYTWAYGAAVACSALSVLLILALPALPVDGDDEDQPQTTMWQDFRHGVGFVARHKVVAPIMTLGFIQILLAAPYPLLPQFLEQFLGVDPSAMGYLMSATSVGALLATALSGWTARISRVGLAVTVTVLASSVAVAALGFTRSFVAALVIMAILGALDLLFEIMRFSILAEETPDAMRGRVFAVWGTQASVSESMGGPILAGLVRALGISGAVVAGGVAATVLSALTVLWWRDLPRWRMPPPPESAGDDPDDGGPAVNMSKPPGAETGVSEGTPPHTTDSTERDHKMFPPASSSLDEPVPTKEA